MRYLLVVGFYCDVYKQEPQARIFVGNKLLDEFFIKHSVKWEKNSCFESKKKKCILEPLPHLEQFKSDVKNLPDLKFYEIELQQSIQSLPIHIDIGYSKNNYNNGFMSKHTSLILKVCDFFPYNNVFMNKLRKYKIKNICLDYSWYRGKNNYQNIIFQLAKNGMKWQGKSGQKINTVPLYTWSVGGDGTFTCNLVKKYGILITKNTKPYRFNFNGLILNYFSNKYKQYANQRNSN